MFTVWIFTKEICPPLPQCLLIGENECDGHLSSLLSIKMAGGWVVSGSSVLDHEGHFWVEDFSLDGKSTVIRHFAKQPLTAVWGEDHRAEEMEAEKSFVRPEKSTSRSWLRVKKVCEDFRFWVRLEDLTGICSGERRVQKENNIKRKCLTRAPVEITL